MKGIVTRPKIKHNVSLTPAQISDLFIKLDKAGGNRTTRIAIELLLLTFVRTVELRKATWAEFDVEGPALWRIPAERMKMGEMHIVTLSRQAVTLIKELHAIVGSGEFVFSSLRSATRPMR